MCKSQIHSIDLWWEFNLIQLHLFLGPYQFFFFLLPGACPTNYGGAWSHMPLGSIIEHLVTCHWSNSDELSTFLFGKNCWPPIINFLAAWVTCHRNQLLNVIVHLVMRHWNEQLFATSVNVGNSFNLSFETDL